MCFKALVVQHKNVKKPCTMKDVILFISCKKQLWDLILVDWVTILGSAWIFFFCVGWVFCRAGYCIPVSSTDINFIQSLENSLDGQLKVIYGDFFRLDPLVSGTLKPPAMCSDKLFETMGVAAVPWMTGICI